uniref:(northern house mosquito) hypothetical protein n=1 Tax=Culex pipiens TaxID=7175 RepID=A0A8D8ALY1_CULPI
MEKLRGLTLLSLAAGFLIISFTNSEAYLMHLRNATNKNFPGECYDAATKIHFKPNTTVQRPLRCEKMTCYEDFQITFAGCGVGVVNSPNCTKVGQNFTLPYPECCRKYKCMMNGKVTFL